MFGVHAVSGSSTSSTASSHNLGSSVLAKSVHAFCESGGIWGQILVLKKSWILAEYVELIAITSPCVRASDAQNAPNLAA